MIDIIFPARVEPHRTCRSGTNPRLQRVQVTDLRQAHHWHQPRTRHQTRIIKARVRVDAGSVSNSHHPSSGVTFPIAIRSTNDILRGTRLSYNAHMDIKASISEDNGIAVLTNDDLQVLSVGISTGGVAEIRMAEANPKRHIVATTIDKEGATFAQKYIAEKHLENQIEAKIEDVAEPSPYPNATFDYIYARLVLHYLPKDKLRKALAELYRVLKPGGKLFVVVRSIKCPDATCREANFDPGTNLTTSCILTDEQTGKTRSYSRYFHTEESIGQYVAEAGFDITYTKAYDEHLYMDFMRTKLKPKTDNVIELLAVK